MKFCRRPSKEVGVLRVDAISELFDMAEVLSKQPRPKGPRLTIVTNSGRAGRAGDRYAHWQRRSNGRSDARDHWPRSIKSSSRRGATTIR